jgi:peptidoglycan/LPS O-acetylase OafA/YrhL
MSVTTAVPQKPAKITELDGLRGLMAALVVSGHLFAHSGIGAANLPKFLRFLTFGGIGVDVFVILSGFVIFFLIDRAHETYGIFITRRFLRLFPAYAVCFLLCVGLSFYVIGWLDSLPWKDAPVIQLIRENWQLSREHFWPHIIWHLTMLHGLWPAEILPNSGGAFLDVAWSISLEWQFYLVAPLLYSLIKRRWTLSLCLIGVWICFYSVQYFGGWGFNGRWATYHLHAFLPLKLHFFFLGIASYFAFERYVAARLSFNSVALSVALVVALIFSDIYAVWIWVLVFGSVLVARGASESSLARITCGLLNTPLLQSMGRVSYSIYLLHMPVIYFSIMLLLRWKTAWSQYSFLASLAMLVAPLLAVGASLMYRFVEKPAMDFGRQLGRSASSAKKTPRGAPPVEVK